MQPLHKLYHRSRKSTFTQLYEQCEASVKIVNLLYETFTQALSPVA